MGQQCALGHETMTCVICICDWRLRRSRESAPAVGRLALDEGPESALSESYQFALKVFVI